MTNEELKAAMKAAGMLVPELAQKLGVSTDLIISWRIGRRGIPLARIPAIQAALVPPPPAVLPAWATPSKNGNCKEPGDHGELCGRALGKGQFKCNMCIFLGGRAAYLIAERARSKAKRDNRSRMLQQVKK